MQLRRPTRLLGLLGIGLAMVLLVGMLFVHQPFTFRSPVTAAPSGACGVVQPNAGSVILPGHLVPVLQGAHPVGMIDCQQTLTLSIMLHMRDQAGFDAFMAALNDPASPDYHHYLTPDEIAARFGPTDATLSDLTAWIQAQGLQVGTVATNHMQIHVTGNAAAIEHAFGIRIALFHMGNRTVYAPLSNPAMPASFASAVQAIVGLDNAARAFPVR